ncbi:uncharacterized protein K441DRAFT_539637 [Cenococcum geophilum 1.58]|uniref:uncharacterized protein n=1 Tax=Cenococcum geophilum 1.58 TaxID=794803 RepID=UPI0035900AC6|nr:hypothetical protein K441DRAFT_539637 [Cenococcum geophilum 1.58]
MGDPRHSTSSRGSNFSAEATAVNPNSSQNTPKVPDFPELSDAVSGAGSSSSSDEDDDVSEAPFPEDPIQGWPQLALLMAKTPDFATFSRFRDLNVKSLLYYQAQLTVLRKKLHDLEYADAGKGKNWAERADKLVESTESDQFLLIKDMRVVLKEYNEALLQYSQICALPDPDTYNMRSLRKWLRYKKGGNFKVRGRDGLENTWGDIYTDPDKHAPSLWRQFGRLLWTLIWAQPPPTDGLDLATTKPQAKIDGLTRWVVWYFIPFYTALRKHQQKKKKERSDVEKAATGASGWVDKVKKQKTLETWSETSALRFTSGASTVVACVLPVVAITVLSQLQGTRDLLLCIAGFAVIFAVGLIFLTQGTSTRVEIFTATAAFSAVMVVFISVPVIILPPGTPLSTPSASPTPTTLS